jgi:hypothetical protein
MKPFDVFKLEAQSSWPNKQRELTVAEISQPFLYCCEQSACTNIHWKVTGVMCRARASRAYRGIEQGLSRHASGKYPPAFELLNFLEKQ